jgi:hypothetical protein
MTYLCESIQTQRVIQIGIFSQFKIKDLLELLSLISVIFEEINLYINE